MSVLINFSSGLDSLYLLLDTLKKSDTKIVLHHCKIINLEGRARVEHVSVKNILNELKEYSDRIEYIETEVNYLKTGYVVRDIEVIAFMTGTILRNPKHYNISKILVSANKHDESNDINEESVVRRREILDSIGPRKNESNLLEFPMLEMTKCEIIKSIPNTLLEKSWYCRKPIGFDDNNRIVSPISDNVKYWINCKKCKTCLQVLSCVGKDSSILNRVVYNDK